MNINADHDGPEAQNATIWDDRTRNASGTGRSAASAFNALIEAEGTGVERTASTLTAVVAVIGAVIAAVSIVLGRGASGWPLLLLAVAVTGYCAAVMRYVERPAVLAAARWINPLLETSAAPVVAVTLLIADGRAYALASWSPPMLYAITLFLQSLRLRPLLPVMMGLYAAGAHALFVWVIGPAIDPGALPDVYAFTSPAQFHRCLTLVVAGICAGGMGVGVRRVLKSGADRVRQQQLFGKYRLGPRIAQGGMGEVLAATYCPDGGFRRDVAIKRIHPHLAADGRFVRAFRAEAELSARLHHPNIVQVLDFGRTGGTYFFAMELVDGLTVSELIRAARAADEEISEGLVAFIGMQVADGLHHAHEESVDADGERLRVVHRDLSPRNILIGRAGTVKITDFGIARALRDARSHQTEGLMGSMAYMSPEHAQGAPTDARSDLFSLGVVLRELLTGRNRYRRESDAQTLLALITEPLPSVLEERGTIDAAWGPLIDRLLDRDVDARFQSAAEVRAALSEIHAHAGKPGAAELRALVTPLLDVPRALEPMTVKVIGSLDADPSAETVDIHRGVGATIRDDGRIVSGGAEGSADDPTVSIGGPGER